MDQERLQLIHTTKDLLITESIISAPHYLSGVKEDHWNELASRIIEANNYARLTELAVQETAFAEAQAAIAVTAGDLKRESGLGETEFETLAA